MSIVLNAQTGWVIGGAITVLAATLVLVAVRVWRQRRAWTAERDRLNVENEKLHVAMRVQEQAVEAAQLDAARALAGVETVLQDTSHRIGNALATVSSLLGLQMLRTPSEEVKQALEAARLRVHAIASVHRRLQPGGGQGTAMADELLQALIQDLASTGGDAIAVVDEIEAIPITARDSTTLGILIGELVSNALKHGFPAGKHGRIVVRLQGDVTGVPVLTVRDNGVGLDSSMEAGEGGLGSVIVKQLAQQFGGVPEYSRQSAGGLSVTIRLPRLMATPT